MNEPAKQTDGTVARPIRKPPVVLTDSGKAVELKPGQRVNPNDAKRLVDICVVFDTTGSMSDKIAGLSDCMSGFVDKLSKLQLDWRFSVVPFGDLTVPGDTIEANLPFVQTADAAKQQIRSIRRNSGGGNNGESSLEAMQAALSKTFRQGAVKVVVFLSDEPPLISSQMTPQVIGKWLRAKEFVCFVVSHPQHGYEPWANENAGKWYPISSHVDTSAMLDFFRKLLNDVAKVADNVHKFGGGSVNRFVIEKQKRPEIGA